MSLHHSNVTTPLKHTKTPPPPPCKHTHSLSFTHSQVANTNTHTLSLTHIGHQCDLTSVSHSLSGRGVYGWCSHISLKCVECASVWLDKCVTLSHTHRWTRFWHECDLKCVTTCNVNVTRTVLQHECDLNCVTTSIHPPTRTCACVCVSQEIHSTHNPWLNCVECTRVRACVHSAHTHTHTHTWLKCVECISLNTRLSVCVCVCHSLVHCTLKYTQTHVYLSVQSISL